MYRWSKSCFYNCMHYAHILLLLLLILVAYTNGLAPKYQTAYACEGKKLTIECEPGDLINLIRANYGRFSITICNDHGNVDWSVNCMFPRSLSVLASRCAHRQSCSVLATTGMFGDPCPGTHKYLEAHYVCISASQTTTTTTMRPTPPWLKAPIAPPLINSSNAFGQPAPRPPVLPAYTPRTPSGLPELGSTTARLPTTATTRNFSVAAAVTPTAAATHDRTSTDQTSVSPANTRIMNGVVGPTTAVHTTSGGTLAAPTSTDLYSGSTVRMLNNNNAVGSSLDAVANDGNNSPESSFYCGALNARNLFWNITKVGDVNVQPCPGGATGIAKWRCVLMKRHTDNMDEIEEESHDDCEVKNKTQNCQSNATLAMRLSQRLRHFGPAWHPATPDLTQCRSLWLNNLEVSVNQRESSLISIANDLSEVTSSKTLYGGDMLVTTKIIQTMSERMFHDKETFTEQRQREAVIMELLHGVVKTGSNLLDESQLASWLDLNQEDQMRVATSLLTGLEYSAFLLADTINKERNVVQKVKNILLAVRVLETKNIQAFEIFPDAEQWQISDDRIIIPRAALVENNDNGLVRVVLAIFDRLESILKPTYDHFDDTAAHSYVRNSVIISNETEVDPQSQRVRILNSKVISASLGKGRHTQLSQPIKLVLRHIKTENVTNPTCVFWNYIDHAWSANGCILESTNRTHSICVCNHLTNFALLMDVVDDHGHSLFGIFDNNMRLLIYISVGVCLVFILIALATLKLFNGDVFMKVSGSNAVQTHASAHISSRAGSRRQQNNIRDQTHEPLTLINSNNNLQQLPIATTTTTTTTISNNMRATTNFMEHHNSMRNLNRNNNFNDYQRQPQSQLQQQQQQVVAAAAVVLANGGAANNLNNLNLQAPLDAVAAAATASITAALQQAGGVAQTRNNFNINRNIHNFNINQSNTDNIIMQANMNDVQYKWWWW